MMNKINTLSEFYDIVESEEKTFIYFYTMWCPDCFRTKTYMSKLIKEYPNLTFYKVDRDDLMDLSAHLGIYGIPSFLIFEKGEELGRFVSKLGKSYLEVKDFIDNTL